MLPYLISQSTANRRRVYFSAVKIDDVTDYLITSEMSGGSWSIKIIKTGTAPATPSSTIITEVNSTDAPGIWYWEGAAVDFDTLGPMVVIIQNTGGTKTSRRREILLFVTATDVIYVTPTVDVVKWLGTAPEAPTTAGVPRVEIKTMMSGVLTATAIATAAFTNAKFADDAISLSKIAADARLGLFGILDSGTCQAGSTGTTLKLRSGASANNNAYANATVYITGGPGALESTGIDSYVGATKVATVQTTWTTTPDATSTYVIVAGSPPGSAPSSSTIAAAVWAKVAVGGYNYGDLMRLMVAVLAGPVTDFTTGTLVFSDPFTGVVRLTVLVDITGRIEVTIGDITST